MDRKGKVEAFFAAHDRWVADSHSQFCEEHPEWAEGQLEYCEDGSVYLGNMTWFPAGTVTPWAESEHGKPFQLD